MLWIILTIITTVGLFIGLGFYNKSSYEMGWKCCKKQFCALLGLLLMIPGLLVRVPANTVGILYSPLTGTSETTLSEGFHIKNPLAKVYKIGTEVQTVGVEGISTQTKDAQFVTTALDIKYRVNPANAFLVFKQFRTLENLSTTLIAPTTQRTLEHVTTKYNVIDVLGEQRPAIYSELEATLAEELASSGVDFYSITILDMDAGDDIEKAITAEAVAKKSVETAEQNLLKAEKEAKQKSVVAQAEQDAARINAETKLIEAKAEKEANELLQQSLTPSILSQRWIEKWDGNTPTYYGGDGTDLIFNTGNVQ